ncbi:hypothetical protein [Thiocapsa sp.]|uniref:hypothetical protein n=1 Tax=Thiocapsa sp. TaxID=2024551 RepID=UPI002C192408|nr:hypothetical protein [Thiocapsa sp.]HSO81510.1 hypothetical protein [Thiocapsa sp.]
MTPVVIIPGVLFSSFPDRPVILGTGDPAEPRALFGSETPANLAFIRLTDLAGDPAPLADWGDGIPLDLLMGDPATELPLLYRCTVLSVRHPVRVTVPFRPGLARAVKLALSLGFSVRLHGHQPSPEAVAEARQALAEYLHNPTVSQPVEPFHTLLIAFLQETPVALWSLLERDPAEVRVLDERGEPVPGQGPESVAAFREALLAAGGECCGCSYLSRCDGYFKWPHSDYSCTGVKRLFADVEAAADELRADLAAHAVGKD